MMKTRLHKTMLASALVCGGATSSPVIAQDQAAPPPLVKQLNKLAA
jgi:hypothetical protein